MKVIVKHICGHEAGHSIAGGGEAREARLEWLRKTPCRKCYLEEENLRLMDRAKEARQACLRLGFPPLTGRSEGEEMNACVVRIKVYENACRTLPVTEHREVRRIIAAEKSAAWWNDHNKDPARVVLNLIIARNPELGPDTEKKKGGRK